MQAYDYDELVNKPGPLTEDEDRYIIIEAAAAVEGTSWRRDRTT
jgi:hypothetical protein